MPDVRFKDAMTRARALAQSLRQMLVCAQDLEDTHQPIGTAIFLASELDEQLERIDDAAQGWNITEKAKD